MGVYEPVRLGVLRDEVLAVATSKVGVGELDKVEASTGYSELHRAIEDLITFNVIDDETKRKLKDISARVFLQQCDVDIDARLAMPLSEMTKRGRLLTPADRRRLHLDYNQPTPLRTKIRRVLAKIKV